MLKNIYCINELSDIPNAFECKKLINCISHMNACDHFNIIRHYPLFIFDSFDKGKDLLINKYNISYSKVMNSKVRNALSKFKISYDDYFAKVHIANSEKYNFNHVEVTAIRNHIASNFSQDRLVIIKGITYSALDWRGLVHLGFNNSYRSSTIGIVGYKSNSFDLIHSNSLDFIEV